MAATKLCVGIFALLAVFCLFSIISAEAFRFKVAHNLNEDASIPTQWFTQRLDHFNAQDQRVWKQRYFVNEQYFKKGTNGPIFLQIGGEGAISTGYVTSFMMSTYAQKYGALQLALEHRFYGVSAPLPDLSTPNLQYLSSHQALADAALFLQSMRNKYNSTSPIIIFGGSYPGNLAAWFRMKYPNLVIGAIASSAPVQATLDFYQYLDVVDQSLSYFTGPQCDATIASASKSIESMLQTTAGRAQIKTQFNLCAPIRDWDDASTFTQALMDNFMGTVQYNNEGSTPININYICGIIDRYQNDPVQAYAAVSNMFLQLQGEKCLDVSYQDSINDLRNLNQGTGDGGRQWVYQTCAEFGYFQTTDSSSDVQPFGNLAPLNYSIQVCQDAFGLNFNTSLLIDQTNALYGGKNLIDGSTNILFINGNIDPWHALSYTVDTTPGIKTILINGTAHCADMNPPTARDPPGLAIAQQQTSQYIGQLLQEYYSLL